jgi:L-iditol 2-dehydrogenase
MADSNRPNDTDIRIRKPENIAVFTNPNHELYLRSSDIPTPGEGECLIHVRSTGICGSDVHFWKAGHIGAMVVEDEAGLGHESAGVVIAIGPNVSRFKEGDRVTLECGVPCMKTTCFSCRNGTYNGCPDVVFFSTPPYHGTMTRYHVHPENWLHKLPDPMTFEEGALLEPLSVAFAGVDRANVRLGDPLVICGAGPIGMVSLLAAAAAGANPIAITDINKDRLQLAKKLVPRVRTVQIDANKEPKEAAEDVKAALGQEAKVVLECTGFEASVCTAIYVSGIVRVAELILTCIPVLPIWGSGACDRLWQRLPDSAIHVYGRQGNRPSFPVPLSRHISPHNLIGRRRNY